MKKLLILILFTPLFTKAQLDSTLKVKIDSLGKVIAYNNMMLNKRIDSFNNAKDTLVGIIGEIKMTQITNANGSVKGTIGIDPAYTQRLEAIEKKLITIKQIL